MLSNSQTILKTVEPCQITFKLVWNCLKNLRALAKPSKVTLVWVPGRKRMANNELAEKRSETTPTGAKPSLTITKSSIRSAIGDWIAKKAPDLLEQL